MSTNDIPRPFQESSHGSIVKRFLVEHDTTLNYLNSCPVPGLRVK